MEFLINLFNEYIVLSILVLGPIIFFFFIKEIPYTLLSQKKNITLAIFSPLFLFLLLIYLGIFLDFINVSFIDAEFIILVYLLLTPSLAAIIPAFLAVGLYRWFIGKKPAKIYFVWAILVFVICILTYILTVLVSSNSELPADVDYEVPVVIMT